MSAGDEYQPTTEGAEGPTTSDTVNNDYQSRTGQSTVPVVSDHADIDDPIDPATADSDETLAKDDSDAIDKSNVIGSRTRGAGPSGGYAEPGDEEGLGGPDDGRSAM